MDSKIGANELGGSGEANKNKKAISDADEEKKKQINKKEAEGNEEEEADERPGLQKIDKDFNRFFGCGG